MKGLFLILLFALWPETGICELNIENVLKKLDSKPDIVRIDDPHAGITTYVAYPLKQVLDHIRKDWRNFSHVRFMASDGFRTDVPVPRIISFAPHLATGIEGKDDFSIFDKIQNKLQKLGPAYLVWDRNRYQELKKESTIYWPYQIFTLEIINLETDKTPVNGREVFLQHCGSCHNSDKSGKAPSENVVTSYMKTRNINWLINYLKSPSDLVKGSSMPGLNLPESTISQIYNWVLEG